MPGPANTEGNTPPPAVTGESVTPPGVQGGAKVPDLISKVADLPVQDPLVERAEFPVGGWAGTTDELKPQVVEWAARERVAEQTKQQLTGEATGTPGVLGESMTDSFKIRDIGEEASGARDRRSRSERLTYNDWRPDVEANLEDLALKAYLEGVHKVVHGELGINDSAELPEEAQDIYRAFTQAVIKARTPATEGESAPDTNAGDTPSTGSTGVAPGK